MVLMDIYVTGCQHQEDTVNNSAPSVSTGIGSSQVIWLQSINLSSVPSEGPTEIGLGAPSQSSCVDLIAAKSSISSQR